MRNFSRLLIPILVALLSWPYLAFSETAKRPPAGKKIFTNEDLEAGLQRYSSTEDPTPSPGQKENSATSKESGTESPGEPKTGE